MHPIQRVKSFIRSRGLLRPQDAVVAAVSGGADSTALLLILNDLKHELGIHLTAAHFNHRLRPSAQKEVEVVRRLAEDLRVDFVTEEASVDIAALPGSIEDNARRLRHDFLLRVVYARSATHAALGHHLDDQAETVLMRIIRGSGSLGLGAIRPIRRIDGVAFIRPLLCLNRREIEEFLQDRGRSFCHDESNDRTDVLRNKIRHELLPLIKTKYNPQAAAALANLAEIFSEDYEVLERLAAGTLEQLKRSCDQGFGIDLSGFQKSPPALQRLMLRLAVLDIKGDMNRIEFTHWLEAEDLILRRPDSSEAHWPGGVCLKKKDSLLIVFLKSPKA